MKLRIALLSYAYAPSVGGIERVSQLIARGLSERGHAVTVITQTPDPSGSTAVAGMRIVRRPGAKALLAELRDADVVLQSNLSVHLAWPLVCRLVRKPWVVVNHTPVTRPNGAFTLRDRLKLATLRRAKVFTVSSYLSNVTPIDTGILPNPIDPSVHHRAGDPSGDLLFVGRVTRAKGLDVLIEALHSLRASGSVPALTVVGDGEDRAAIEQRAVSLGLPVTFLGAQPPHRVAEQMRAHRVLVVPSRPEPPEALPLVVLEAIACGCAVIASNQGGLPEAIGRCGFLVRPEDPADLADAIGFLLQQREWLDGLRANGPRHIAPYLLDNVVAAYEAALATSGREPDSSFQGLSRSA